MAVKGHSKGHPAKCMENSQGFKSAHARSVRLIKRSITLRVHSQLSMCFKSSVRTHRRRIVRMETNGKDTDNNTEMVLWCIHQKVFEAFWSDGETFPSKVVVDDVLN